MIDSKNFSAILQQKTGINSSQIEGSGAAGGIGEGLVSLLNAELKNGFETIASLTNLENQIESADWVISGEGKLDKQSLQGKVVGEISTLCKKHQKPLSLLVEKNELSKNQINNLKVKHIFSIMDHAKHLDGAFLNGHIYLKKMAAKLF